MKGVVLAAGPDTLLDPLTRITSKYLLPVFDRPMVCWPIRTLVEAGVDDVAVVVPARFRNQFADVLGSGGRLGLRRLTFVTQEGSLGIGGALRLVRHHVDGEPCAVLLGDNIFEESLKPEADSFAGIGGKGAHIFLKHVPDPHRFGVPRLDQGRIVEIEEKPLRPASSYAVTGAYLYDQTVWGILDRVSAGPDGLTSITCVNNAYIQAGCLRFSLVRGWWVDAGTFDSLLLAGILASERARLLGHQARRHQAAVPTPDHDQ